MDEDPDEALGLLADLTGATDPRLRELARRLAGRLMLDIGRRSPSRRRGVGRLVRRQLRSGGGDLDVDASIEALAGRPPHTRVIDPESLQVRDWTAPQTALCLLVDRSGSMGGRPLATSAVAAASVALRTPDDYSVIAFGSDVVVAKSQDAAKTADTVVNDVLTLRGHGTTDLAGALQAASRQLARSRAGRRVTILLSDCRPTVDGDVLAAAAALEELLIIAPVGDDEEARVLAADVGARLSTVSGPSDVPRALAAVFDGDPTVGGDRRPAQ